MAEDECRGGGEPFSDEVLRQFRRLQQATSKEERQQALAALAAAAAASHDTSDESATDDYHRYFEQYAAAKLAFEQAAQRVGRLTADCLNQFYTGVAPEAEAPEGEVPKEMN